MYVFRWTGWGCLVGSAGGWVRWGTAGWLWGLWFGVVPSTGGLPWCTTASNGGAVADGHPADRTAAPACGTLDACYMSLFLYNPTPPSSQSLAHRPAPHSPNGRRVALRRARAAPRPHGRRRAAPRGGRHPPSWAPRPRRYGRGHPRLPPVAAPLRAAPPPPRAAAAVYARLAIRPLHRVVVRVRRGLHRSGDGRRAAVERLMGCRRRSGRCAPSLTPHHPRRRGRRDGRQVDRLAVSTPVAAPAVRRGPHARPENPSCVDGCARAPTRSHVNARRRQTD